MLPRWSKGCPLVEASVAGNDYRSGRKRVEVLLPLALHANVRAAALITGRQVFTFRNNPTLFDISRPTEIYLQHV